MARTKAASRRALFGRKDQRIADFAMVQPQITQARLSSSNLRTIDEGVDKPNQVDKLWQRSAFELSDQVGELGYLHNLTADTGSRCDLAIEEWNGTRWVSTENEPAVRVLKAFVGPRGGQTELKRRGILHLAIAGESYLIGVPARTSGAAPAGIVWEFVSTEELHIEQGGAVKRRRDGSGMEELSSDVYIARMWKSHPRWSDQADSATRRILPIAREIVVLTQLVDAVAKSRLHAGIFFVPDEVSFASQDHEDTDTDFEDDDPEGIDEFTEELQNHLKAPVEDRTNAAALIPLLMRGPGTLGEHPTKDLMGLIDLQRELDTWAQELRREALHRLASGMDAPPETLEGKGALNHWSAYNIDQEFISKHVAPRGDLLADFLTEAYLRPMLEEFEAMTPEQSGKYRLVFDTAAVRTVTDEAANGRIVYDRKEASGAALRRTHGLTDADAPAPEELRARKAEELLARVPTLAATLLPLIPGFEDVKIVMPTGPTPSGVNPAQGNTPIVSGTPGVPGTPQTQRLPAGRKEAINPPVSNGSEVTPSGANDVPATRTGGGLANLIDRMAVAGDSALERAFERAGAKLSAAVANKKDDPLYDRCAGIDKTLVLSVAAPSDVTRLGWTQTKLLDGSWDRVSAQVRRWIRDHLEREGEDTLTADDRSALAASNFCAELDAYARAYFHRPLPPCPNGLRVPEELVIRALSTALPVAVVA